MAVQAQYTLNAFTPDFRSRGAPNNAFEDLPLQYRENQAANMFGGYGNYAGQHLFNGAVFSDLESELTCNVSGSRKRNRQVQMNLPQQDDQRQKLSQHFGFLNMPKIPAKIATAGASTGLQLSYEENRLNESNGTSTSGRSAAVTLPIISPLPPTQDLVSYLCQQNLEINALIKLQNDKLRTGLEQVRKRHCSVLLSAIEQQVLKRLIEKESELESACRRNVELQEKVKQMSAENQIWFNVAKNNEAIVSGLKTSLEQILLQNMSQTKEGFGDSDGICAVIADDTQSCCYVGEEDKKVEKIIQGSREMKRRSACKVCRENDVSVLLLPCRHLCLCKDCELKTESCPICSSMKNASLEIFMS